MFIIMSGYPLSGKSTFLSFLDKEADLLVIDPKHLLVPEYQELSEKEKSNAYISAWECSLELLEERLTFYADYHCIIYDTAASSPCPILEKIKVAKKHGHTIVYVFVNAPRRICEERAEKDGMDVEVMERYYRKFKDTIPVLKKNADIFVRIDNNGTLEDLKESTRKLLDKIDGLRLQ